MSSANAQAEIGVPLIALPDHRAISRRGGEQAPNRSDDQ
jgi:hypothetical protein